MVESTNSVTAPPAGVNVSDLMDAYTKFTGQVSDSKTDLDNVIQTAQDAAGSKISGAGQVAAGQSLVISAEGAAAAQLYSDNARAAATVGLTPGKPSQLVTDAISRYAASQTDLNNRYTNIQSKQDLNFGDDPLQWIINQVSLPFDMAAYNTAASSSERNLGVVRGLSEAFSEISKVNSVVDVADAATVASGKTQIAAGQASMIAGDAQLQLARMGLDGVNLRQSMDTATFAKMMDVYSADVAQQKLEIDRSNLVLSTHRSANEDVQLGLSVAQGARSAESLKLQQAEAARSEDRLAMDKTRAEYEKATNDYLSGEREKKVAGEAYLQDRLNDVSTVLGTKPIPVSTYMTDPKIHDFYADLVASPDITKYRLGKDIPSAMEVAGKSPNTLPIGMQFTANILNDVNQATIKAGGTIWNSLGKDTQRQRSQEAYNLYIKNSLANIPMTGNIFSPPSIAGALGMKSLLLNPADPSKGYRNPLMNEIAMLGTADPQRPLNGNDLFAIGYKRLQAGLDTPESFGKNFSDLYTATMADISITRQFSRFNVPMLDPTTTGYRQTIQGIGGFNFNGTRVVNQSKASEVTNAFIGYVASRNVSTGLTPNQ